jgi:organic radical activating enzyme
VPALVRDVPVLALVVVGDWREKFMISIRESIQRLITPVKPISSGIYHYKAPAEDPRNYSLHLRLEADGSGLLIVNASTILHLNQTASEYAYYLVQHKSEEEAARSIASRYRISFSQAREDYCDFLERIDTLVTIRDLDPVTELEFSRKLPYSSELSAPFRLDCALTYRLPSNASLTYTHQDRVKSELDVIDWKRIFDIAWQHGIPHLILTGGEPTLRDDLFDLIQHAQSNGQVTGLLTDGHRFVDHKYFFNLLQTGLDHLLIVAPLEVSSTWDMLATISSADISTTVHITITKDNHKQISSILKKIVDNGIKSVSLSTSSESMNEQLIQAHTTASEIGLSLIWDIPVPYSELNPISLEFSGRELRSGVGKAWLYVEPDGDVLPDQSINKVLGNLLTDPWEKIWHPDTKFVISGMARPVYQTGFVDSKPQIIYLQES